MDPPPTISVIVPVLDEEARVGALLEGLVGRFDEVLVVDGGSSDRTLERARAVPGVEVVCADRGRAVQMNAGAALASGEVLLFLHADVALPEGAPAIIRAALRQPESVAGAFAIWTVVDDTDAPRQWLAPLLHLADLRSRLTRIPYGDQAIFVRADAFWRIGGYPELPLMEDLELSRRLWRVGRVVRARGTVRVSGRRFLARPVFYTTVINVFPALYRLGVPTPWLAAVYRNIR